MLHHLGLHLLPGGVPHLLLDGLVELPGELLGVEPGVGGHLAVHSAELQGVPVHLLGLGGGVLAPGVGGLHSSTA